MVELLDSQLAVRLVSCAGSLAKLALPSSTIQLLGAEKRFPTYGRRFLASQARYFVPTSFGKRNASKEQRESLSFTSSKVAIAAKIDFYRGKDECVKF